MQKKKSEQNNYKLSLVKNDEAFSTTIKVE